MPDRHETVSEMVARARGLRYEERYGEAVDLFDAALVEARHTGSPSDLIPALKGVAQVMRDTDRPREALPYYVEAIELCRAQDDWAATAHTLRHLGDTYLGLEDAARAEPPLTETLSIYREHAGEVGAPEVANTVRVVAILREQEGRPDEALELWREARGLYDLVGIPEGVAECNAHVAALHAD